MIAIAGIACPVSAFANACMPGYVWREAFPGDLVCVLPEVRDQAAADNAAATSRVAACRTGYVPRAAVHGDQVCVTQDAKAAAAIEKSLNPQRSTFIACARFSVNPSDCPAPAPCKRGFVHRLATPEDYVCAPEESRRRVQLENERASQNKGVDTCVDGYVWRAASPLDRVCVLPWVRDQAARDNASAAGRRDPRPARCDAYAKSAVAQAEEYLLRGCGQASDRWQTNYLNHFNFCMGPHGNIADREARARQGTLGFCRTINPLPGAAGGPMSSTCNFSVVVRNAECLNLDGTPSWVLIPGALTSVGCGADRNSALEVALAGFGTQAAISDHPTPGACTYTAQTSQGCLCH